MNPFNAYTWKNGLTMRNRLVMAPMTTYSGNPDLTVSAEELAYYAQRATTIGMVITAACAINTQAQAFENQISCGDDRFVPSLNQLAQTIKRHGALAVLQVHHGGRMNDPALFDDPNDIVSASAIKAPRQNVQTPRAMREDEVKHTIKDYAEATRRAVEAGFDGVELHGANTYLLQQFFSPHSNRREDAYGGTREKRMRFILETVREAARVVTMHASGRFLLGYRFSPEELETPGITLADTEALVASLAKEPLDFLHISLGRYDQTSIRDAADTRRIVDAVQGALQRRLPLIGVGGIETKKDVKQALEIGYDLVAAGMPLLADPKWGETIQHDTAHKRLNPDTLPTLLYTRLSKNRQRFEKSGYTFPQT